MLFRSANGGTAIGIFNFGNTYRRLRPAGLVDALPPGAAVRDAWRQKDLGKLSADSEFGIPEHGVLLLTIAPVHH